MNNRTLIKYLRYFLENRVDLSDQNRINEIDEIFGWQVFAKNLNILEEESYIVENSDRNSYSLTEKGKTTLHEIKSELEFDDNKQKAELESLKTSADVNKFLLKTKWVPHIVALLSLLFSIYTYFDARKDSKNLEVKINKLESKLETYQSNSTKKLK